VEEEAKEQRAWPDADDRKRSEIAGSIKRIHTILNLPKYLGTDKLDNPEGEEE